MLFFDILIGCYDVIMNFNPLSNHQFWRCILKYQKYITILEKSAQLLNVQAINHQNRHFSIMTSRDDVTDIKQNQICNLCVHTFHLRYHSTMSDLRIEKSPFFTPPLWRHNQKFGGQWRHQKFGHILKTLFWEFGENIQSRFHAIKNPPHFGHFSPTSPRERDTRTHAQQHYIKI